MQYRVFILTMPNTASWNGKWTGQDKLYCVVKKYTDKSRSLLNVDKRNGHYYNFGDGWGAFVEIKRVSSEEAAKYRKRSAGFYGYERMVDEIEEQGRILPVKDGLGYDDGINQGK
jgi:hypothetical protein